MRSWSSSKPPTSGACPGWRRSTYGTAPTSGPRDCARTGGHGRARRSSPRYGRGPTSMAAPRTTISGRRATMNIHPPARSPTCSAAGRPRCAPPTSLPRCMGRGARPRSSTGSKPSRTHTAVPRPAATWAIPAALPTRPPPRSSAPAARCAPHSPSLAGTQPGRPPPTQRFSTRCVPTHASTVDHPRARCGEASTTDRPHR
jgi:hypothetical protein